MSFNFRLLRPQEHGGTAYREAERAYHEAIADHGVHSLEAGVALRCLNRLHRSGGAAPDESGDAADRLNRDREPRVGRMTQHGRKEWAPDGL